ncbi:hypothetical protein [Pseudomonas sp.]|uniref:hypothetical protein n=1 Tax=Pseudomonas sp. TaxID=306 RepID=UPI002735021B|nr:hypothetical protein [Pseudomonas sp.]MDP3816686.1 hypothetical protein [Pseudomonas sp.]
MNRSDNEAEILNALGHLIGQHADWLDGRTFQRLCGLAADAYFEPDDLDSELDPDEVPGLLADLLGRELGLEGLADA